MNNYMKEFVKYMDDNDIIYNQINENVINVTYDGVNIDVIPIYVFFDENSEMVQIRCKFINFTNNEISALKICNKLNDEYRWMKFFLNNEKEIVATVDAILDLKTCGKKCLFWVECVVKIVDDVYPQILRARGANFRL